MSQERHLAAILFTDIVGYTAIMQKHEATAVSIIKHYHEVLEKSVPAHRGEILNNYGDGSLCSFRSSLDALHCALELQHELQSEPAVPLRIGLHTGEIFFENGKVLGDAVNIASRIQSLGIANSILISSEIQTKLKNQPEFKTVSLGSFQFKNVDDKTEVFALANEGLAIPERNKLEGKLQSPRYSKRLGWMAAGLLLLILAGYFFLPKFIKPVDNTEKSIAVLFFENFTNDPELEGFCDGITDEILSHLSKIKSLHVTSRTSAKVFKGTKVLSIPEIAKKLGVNYVLEGSVRKSGNQVRITAQLIDAITDEHMWSEDYDYHELEDIFPVQTDVSTKVSEVLKIKLTQKEEESLSKKYTENIAAYKLYRRGRNFWDQRTKASYDSAEACYKRAIELDPDYALAYSGLADCYTFNQKGMPQVEAIPIAKVYAEKALSLDSTLCEAWTTIGFIQSHYDFNWAAGKGTLEKAVRYNQNYPIAHLYLGNVLLHTKHFEEGLLEIKKALALDPLSVSINFVLGRSYYQARKFDLAIPQLRKALVLNPNNSTAYSILGNCFLLKKLFPQAFDAFSKLPMEQFDQGNDGRIMMAYAYAITGDRNNAIAELNKISPEDKLNSFTNIAYPYIALGNFKEALSLLERRYDSHSLGIMGLAVDPNFDPIRNEPRFKALLKKMNFE